MKGVPVLDERSLQENQAILFPSGTSSAAKKFRNDETNDSKFGFFRRPQTYHDATTTLVVHQTSPGAIYTPRTVLGLRQGSDLAAIKLNLNHPTNEWLSSDAKVAKHSTQEKPTLLSQDKQCITFTLPSCDPCCPTVEVVHTVSLRCVPCTGSVDGFVSPVTSRPCLCNNPLLPTNRQQLPPESLNSQTGEQIVLPAVFNPLRSNNTVDTIQPPCISEQESNLDGLVAKEEQDSSQMHENSSTRACCYGSAIEKSSNKRTGNIEFTSEPSSDQQLFSEDYRRTGSLALPRQKYAGFSSRKIQHSYIKHEKTTTTAPVDETGTNPTSTLNVDSPKRGTCCPRVGHTTTHSAPDSVYTNQPPSVSRSSDKPSERTSSTAEVKCCRKSTKPKTVVVESDSQDDRRLEVSPLNPRAINEPLSPSVRNLEAASVEVTNSVLSRQFTQTLEHSQTNQDEDDRPSYFCFRRRRKWKPILKTDTQIAESLEPGETLGLTSVSLVTQPMQIIEYKPPIRSESREHTSKSDLWRQVSKSRSEPSQLSQPIWEATARPTETPYSNKTQSRSALVESDVISKEMDLSKELSVQTTVSEVIDPVKVVRHDPSDDQTVTHHTILNQTRSVSLEKAPKFIAEHPEWTPHESVSVEQHIVPSCRSTYCEDEKIPLYNRTGSRKKWSSEAAHVEIEYRVPSHPGTVEQFDAADSHISRPCSAAETTHRFSEISYQLEPNQDYTTLGRTDLPYDSSDDEFCQTVPVEVPTNPTMSTHRNSTHLSWDPLKAPTCGCHYQCPFPVVCVPFPYVATAKMSSAWHCPTATAFSCTCCCNCYWWCAQPPQPNPNLPFFSSEPVQRQPG
ncbi:hypothetical protein P879_06849 [Paragonimus westermani]|uniref:Uncharacterized protein n=1 Tax=Paragonimus westermani TaxID=34504 RepID=A0A8T0DND0_9TREM|nr:hypothetical protein P879_06849 [Paragonimus westermani]